MSFWKLFFVVVFSMAIFSAKADERPLVYKAMENIKVPYTALCEPDQEVVQEYLLAMEIDYLTWLYNQELKDGTQSTVIGLLIGRKNAFTKLQSQCLEAKKIKHKD